MLESWRCPKHNPPRLGPRKSNCYSDVNGILIDGKLYIFPPPAGIQQSTQQQAAKHAGHGGFGSVSQSLIEAKGFHAHDGTAISLARLAGIKTGLTTKRVSETAAVRARDLSLDYVYQGTQDKLTAFEETLRQGGLNASEAAFAGDDIIDLPMLRNCGLTVAVENAQFEVKAAPLRYTPTPGEMAPSAMRPNTL
jgi:3-deoxy-D-manno-octulosonate 8-phosphate phosphatase (KDO 8-P phosphatase)